MAAHPYHIESRRCLLAATQEHIMTTNAQHPGYREAACELTRLAKQASDAVGILVRWHAYMEINPDHAITQMQKTLGSKRANPRLREAANDVLQMVRPEALKEIEKRRAERDARRAKYKQISQRARQWEKLGLSWSQAYDKAERGLTPNERSKDVKPIQDGNVVEVEFGGAS